MESANLDVREELEDSEENIPENPEENIPENPEENIPENPEKNIPENPEENIPENPEENVPENPEENVPENPEENVPENPEENVPENPEKNIPENPEENVPENPEENSSTTRHGLISCLQRTWLEITVFFFGLTVGVPGGLLLGRVATVVVQSLELLAEDKLLMDHLVNFMNTVKDYDHYLCEQISLERRRDNLYVFNILISIFAEEFGALAGILSSVVGLAVGWLMYELVMKTSGESARGKALSLAGPLCLTVISVVGCLLGHLLHMYLSITLTVIIGFSFAVVAIGLFFIFMKNCGRCSVFLSLLTMWAFSPLNTPIVVCLTFPFTFAFQTKVNLSWALTPKMSALTTFAKSCGFNIITTPISFLMIVTDVFNFARQPILTLQQANTNSTGSAAVEGLFVGVLSTYFLMMSMGLSLFTFKEITGAGKIGAGAVASGVAVIAVIESAVPVLGPGPAIGALMGVAGAVGVTLTATVLAASQYGLEMGTWQLMGVVGVTAGAAVGAYLTSLTHSGLSALYMCLSAAAIPVSIALKYILNVLQRHHAWSVIDICLFLLMVVLSVVWVSFIVPIQGVLTFIACLILSTATCLVFFCVSCAFDFWGLNLLRSHRQDESNPFSAERQLLIKVLQLMNVFTVGNLSQTIPVSYNEIGSKVVHFSEALRQRLRSSQSNRAVDAM